MKYCILALFICILPSHYLFAHGSGFSYEETKDGYLIDIGYDPEVPTQSDRVRFDFTVSQVDSATAVEDPAYTDVWVRIMHGEELFFSGNIHKPIFGPTGFNVVFPDAGTYDITARFQSNGKKVVETSFPFVIEAEAIPVDWTPWLIGGMATLLGLGGGVAITRKKTHV